MNPGRFYMPGYIGMGNAPIRGSMLGIANTSQRGTGFLSKITNSIRGVNWGGFLNNANKTLNVVNQAIPLVRQAGPMFNNMKSMLRIAKAFGSETVTTNSHYKNNFNKNIISNNVVIDTTNNDVSGRKKEVLNDNYPNFFI